MRRTVRRQTRGSLHGWEVLDHERWYSPVRGLSLLTILALSVGCAVGSGAVEDAGSGTPATDSGDPFVLSDAPEDTQGDTQGDTADRIPGDDATVVLRFPPNDTGRFRWE